MAASDSKPLPILSYEAAGARAWGPWVWRPSVWSIVLLVLVAGLGAWVKWRHEAWRLLWRGSAQPNVYGGDVMLLPRDDHLLLRDFSDLRLWDIEHNRPLPVPDNYGLVYTPHIWDSWFEFVVDGNPPMKDHSKGPSPLVGRDRYATLGRRPETWIMTTATGRPVAILPVADAVAAAGAPSENTVALLDAEGQVTVWRKVGYECRESILGVLGMPHVWGLICAAGLWALVMWRDARRGGEPAGGGMTAAALAMVLVGAGMSVMMFLEWCIGRRELNPGPLVLLCGIGLGVGGRGWRWAAILVLAGCLALGGWGLQAMWQAGVKQAVELRVLDRVWEAPGVMIVALVGAAMAGAAGALVVVARKA